MKGKHQNPLKHLLATAIGDRLRSKIHRLVDWEPLVDAEPGCTAIIGMCSRLPEVLAANIRCLNKFRWPDLKRVLVVVDCEETTDLRKLEAETRSACSGLKIEFLFYSPKQAAIAKSINLGFVYSWLSWCIALKCTNTKHVLIHDYDALVLSSSLGERYRVFADSGSAVQGITWYQGNGVEAADHLATTFEAFVDTKWLRSRRPVELFNKVRNVGGRSIDFDTTLDIQHRLLTPEQRTMMPMNVDALMHPSQMICQYTMFRHSPAAELPCFSIPMIPFFIYLSGRTAAIETATMAIKQGDICNIDLLNDGTCFNLSKMDIPQVDWLLKQAVQACGALQIPPSRAIYEYGTALYGLIGTPTQDVWRGDFTSKQRSWIQEAQNS
jgi:hypothetical protein